MGKREKDRGKDAERQIVADLHKKGFSSAERVPLSGALASLPGDIIVTELDLLIESKTRTTLEVSGARYFRVDLDWLWKIHREAAVRALRNACVVIRAKGTRRKAVLADYDEYIQLLKDAESWRRLRN